jgi:hypothetical protein
MGTLGILGSKFLKILKLMGIWSGADGGDICCGVTPLRRWGGELSTNIRLWRQRKKQSENVGLFLVTTDDVTAGHFGARFEVRW